MDLKETDILGDDIAQHWYYRSKARAMVRLIGKPQPSAILDVGAGSGFFSRQLLDTSNARNAWCVDTSYPADSEAMHSGKPLLFRRSVDQVEADMVLLMDVLEHVDDDVGLLSTYVSKVPPGARFLISVPAFQFLWSPHDEFLEHKRRYTLGQIEAVAKRSGLRLIKGCYYFGGVFPLAAVTRLASSKPRNNAPLRSQLSRHHPAVNRLLATVCGLELPFMQFNRLAGLTVFCLAEKPR